MKKIYIFFVISFLLIPINISAACTNTTCVAKNWQASGGDTIDKIVQRLDKKDNTIWGKYHNQEIFLMARQLSGTNVYCIKDGAAIPAAAYTVGNACNTEIKINSNSTTNEKLRAAIGYILHKSEKYPGAYFDKNDNLADLKNSYMQTQYLIHQVLAAKNGDRNLYTGEMTSVEKTIYNNALREFNNYKSQAVKIGDIVSNLNGDNYDITAKLTVKNINATGTYTLKAGSTVLASGEVGPTATELKISVAKSKITTGKLELIVSYEETFYLASFKNCGSGKQPITESTTTTDKVATSDSAEISVSYTATFNSNGGTAANPSTITKICNSKLGTLPTTSRTGYTFQGWYTAKDGGTKVTSDTKLTSNVTYYAHWTPNKLTVNYRTWKVSGGKIDGQTLTSPDDYTTVRSHSFYYDTNYTNGLHDYSYSSAETYLYRIGYKGTGNWETGDEKYSVHEKTAFSTGQALAEAFGKDLKNGDATVYVYPEWTPNKLTVNYYSNYADKSFEGPDNAVSSSKNVKVKTYKYNYGVVYKDGIGIQDYTNLSDNCYLARTGFIASGEWNTKVDRTGITVSQGITHNTAQELALVLGVDISYGNATVDLYPQWLVPFEINKVNTWNRPITSKVYFSIYNNENDCIANRNPYPTNVITQNGKSDGLGLYPGTYYIRETAVQDTKNYYVDNACHRIDVGEGQENKITVTNQTKCERDFKDDIYSRINAFKNDYPEFNNLLAFNKPAKEACTGYTHEHFYEGNCTYLGSIGLSVYNEETGYEFNFNGEDLSAFNETIKQNNEDIGYCFTTFFSTDIQDNSIPGPIKAGTLIVGSKNEYAVALTARLTKTCYVYKKDVQVKNIAGMVGFEDTATYRDYVDAIIVNGEPLFEQSDVDSPIFMKYEGVENSLSKFVGDVSVDYTFPPVYATSISGRLCSSSEGPMCHNIGFGIISEFQDGKKTADDSSNDSYLRSYDVNFEFGLRGKSVFPEIKQTCQYKVEPEIIKYNDDDNGKIDIEFRVVDTNNPFNRTPKSNWNDGSDEKNSKNVLINDYILDATNSHGIKKGESEKQTPKYKITLTSNIINEIKEYNDSNSYDDYEICEEDTCESMNAFIDEYIKKGIIQKEN